MMEEEKIERLERKNSPVSNLYGRIQRPKDPTMSSFCLFSVFQDFVRHLHLPVDCSGVHNAVQIYVFLEEESKISRQTFMSTVFRMNLVLNRTSARVTSVNVIGWYLSIDVWIVISIYSHKSHDTCTLGKKLEQAREFLQKEMDSLNTSVRSVKKTVEELEKLSTDIKENTTHCIKDVRKQARDLTNTIDQIAEQQVKVMTTIELENLTPIKNYKKCLNDFTDKAQSVCRFLEDLQEDDMSLELECYAQYKKNVDAIRDSIHNKNISVKSSRSNLVNSIPGRILIFSDSKSKTEPTDKLFLACAIETCNTLMSKVWSAVNMFKIQFTMWRGHTHWISEVPVRGLISM
ncbi:unnamed protein product [Mytilus coruscus]|uniref:Uncharacterized protein n=1 Tax=Mytilus coruscus TaxID=42192 RepID=A0A6J8CN75_MYTCO|nr:unnamed protein product [Mytilus coruscus]